MPTSDIHNEVAANILSLRVHLEALQKAWNEWENDEVNDRACAIKVIVERICNLTGSPFFE